MMYSSPSKTLSVISEFDERELTRIRPRQQGTPITMLQRQRGQSTSNTIESRLLAERPSSSSQVSSKTPESQDKPRRGRYWFRPEASISAFDFPQEPILDGNDEDDQDDLVGLKFL